jgi:hypothetical protein
MYPEIAKNVKTGSLHVLHLSYAPAMIPQGTNPTEALAHIYR